MGLKRRSFTHIVYCKSYAGIDLLLSRLAKNPSETLVATRSSDVVAFCESAGLAYIVLRSGFLWAGFPLYSDIVREVRRLENEAGPDAVFHFTHARCDSIGFAIMGVLIKRSRNVVFHKIETDGIEAGSASLSSVQKIAREAVRLLYLVTPFRLLYGVHQIPKLHHGGYVGYLDFCGINEQNFSFTGDRPSKRDVDAGIDLLNMDLPTVSILYLPPVRSDFSQFVDMSSLDQADAIIKRYSPVIKTHPNRNEPDRTLSLPVYLPAEVIVRKCKIRVMVGVFSTSFRYAAAEKGVAAVSVIKLIQWRDLVTKDLFEQYLASWNVTMPESWAEFTEVINLRNGNR